MSTTTEIEWTPDKMISAARAQLDVLDTGGDEAFRLAHLIRAVLFLHKPMAWYEECVHRMPDEGTPASDVFWEAHRWYGRDGEVLACEESRQPDRCGGCTPEGADDDVCPSVPWPCPTMAAVLDGLGVAR